MVGYVNKLMCNSQHRLVIYSETQKRFENQSQFRMRSRRQINSFANIPVSFANIPVAGLKTSFSSRHV